MIQGGLPKNSQNCTTLDRLVFDISILTVEPFAKDLRIFETCLLVINNLCRKLVLSSKSSITFDKRFNLTLVQFLFLILIYLVVN